MREIKFRVWDNNKMCKVEGFVNGKPFVDFRYDNDFEQYEIMDYQVLDGNNLMQYTGMKDKNGKEIYEGDIVSYFKDELAEIKFINGCFAIKSNSYIDYFNQIIAEIEVVGNIYESKDLLK